MKPFRFILFAVIIVIAAAAIYGYREYYRKPVALTEVSADLALPADALLTAYSTNEDAANKKYLGRILDVTGQVASIASQQDTVINILLGRPEGMAHVSCSVSSTEASKIKKMAAGQSVTIRGVCTGYLMDVELNRCIIVK